MRSIKAIVIFVVIMMFIVLVKLLLVKGLCIITHNVLQLGEVADLKALTFNLTLMFI
jgi:hypothetical protein